jgi:hypothetical protein
MQLIVAEKISEMAITVDSECQPEGSANDLSKVYCFFL